MRKETFEQEGIRNGNLENNFLADTPKNEAFQEFTIALGNISTCYMNNDPQGRKEAYCSAKRILNEFKEQYGDEGSLISHMDGMLKGSYTYSQTVANGEDCE